MCACATLSLSLSPSLASNISFHRGLEVVEEEDIQCSKDWRELRHYWWTIHEEPWSSVWGQGELQCLMFYSVEDAISTRIALFLWATLPVPSIIYVLRSRRSQASFNEGSMAVLSPSRVSEVPSSRWFYFRSTTYKHTNMPCSEDDWCPSLVTPCLVLLSSWFSPTLLLTPCRCRPTWLSISRIFATIVSAIFHVLYM